MDAETDGQASRCNHGSSNKIDNKMVPQIDRRNNKASDEGKKPEENTLHRRKWSLSIGDDFEGYNRV